MTKFRIVVWLWSLAGLVCADRLAAEPATPGKQAGQVKQWGLYEVAYTLRTPQNPFTDVEIAALFTHCDGQTLRVEGFYDGDDTFRIRFMPVRPGEWTFRTRSNVPALDGRTGSLTCLPAEGKGCGPVRTGSDHDFRYADGTRYDPVGTTSYAWIYGDDGLREKTLKSLEQSGFNKIRFCVFPNNGLPEADYDYPFPIVSTSRNRAKEFEADEVNGDGVRTRIDFVWDFTRFNIAFFRRLEESIRRLDQIGVEADVILFNPYDRGRWGFDRMTMECNLRYLKYLIARIGAFKNVWWSMANEWDYMKNLDVAQWKQMSEFVSQADPYHHLLSIHGSTATYFDYNLPWFTHASIQDQGPLYNHEGAATVRNIYPKPILFDEVCYEGDHPNRWGQLSGEEMIRRMWMGLIGGAYVTHGEIYTQRPDCTDGVYFLLNGGEFRGAAPARIRFMRSILDALPEAPRLADRSWDPVTAGCGDGVYLVYLGAESPRSWPFSLPMKNDRFAPLKGGERFRVEIIDTWNMTSEACPTIFETAPSTVKRLADRKGRAVRLPGRPDLLLKITRQPDSE